MCRLNRLIISQPILEEIEKVLCEAYPREGCGILLGNTTETEWVVKEVRSIRNQAPAQIKDRYEMDPHERLREVKSAAARGLQHIGFFHSHPDHGVYFSETDLKNSEEYAFGEPWVAPTYAYLVVSIVQQKPQGYSAFQIHEGKALPVPVHVEPS